MRSASLVFFGNRTIFRCVMAGNLTHWSCGKIIPLRVLEIGIERSHYCHWSKKESAGKILTWVETPCFPSEQPPKNMQRPSKEIVPSNLCHCTGFPLCIIIWPPETNHICVKSHECRRIHICYIISNSAQKSKILVSFHVSGTCI